MEYLDELLLRPHYPEHIERTVVNPGTLQVRDQGQSGVRGRWAITEEMS